MAIDPMAQYRVQYDERGRPFMERPGEKRNYISPLAMMTADPNKPIDGNYMLDARKKLGLTEGGLFHSGSQFNNDTSEWDNPINWGNIASLVAAGVISAGAASALMTGAGAAPTAAGAAQTGVASGAGAALPEFGIASLGETFPIGTVIPSSAGAVSSGVLGGAVGGGLGGGLGAGIGAGLASDATPVGAYGPMAGGYAGATTSATVPPALASSGEAASSALSRFLNTGSKILGGGNGQPGRNMANIGSLLESFANDAQYNRNMRGNFTQAFDRNMLQAQRDRDQVESDAIKKLAQTKYILSGGADTKPTSIQLGGQQRQLPDYGFGPTPSSVAQKQGAQTLQGELVKRLAPGGTYTPRPLEDYAKAGLGEKIGNYGAAGASGLGAILNFLGGLSSNNQTPTATSLASSATNAIAPAIVSRLFKGVGF